MYWNLDPGIRKWQTGYLEKIKTFAESPSKSSSTYIAKFNMWLENISKTVYFQLPQSLILPSQNHLHILIISKSNIPFIDDVSYLTWNLTSLQAIQRR